jgi:hypothetical protein
MGIDPYFDLWNQFFRVRHSQGLGAEAAVLGGVDVYVKFGHGVDPYFHLPMSDSLDGRQKVWFFVRNDITAPLPTFSGNHPIPQPNLGYGVAKRDLRRQQYMCEVVQQLRQQWLTGVNLLRTFFSHRVQLLHQRATTMWMYPGSSCPDCPSSRSSMMWRSTPGSTRS